jgi:heme/copper-type cytochrome/quinol oxidase subunit 2
MLLLQHLHEGWALFYLLILIIAVLIVVAGLAFIVVRRIRKARSSKK